MNVEKVVIATIARYLGINSDEIKLTSSFIDDLGTDSLDEVEIIMSLEDTLDISISEDDVLNLVTVQDMVNIVNGKVK